MGPRTLGRELKEESLCNPKYPHKYGRSAGIWVEPQSLEGGCSNQFAAAKNTEIRTDGQQLPYTSSPFVCWQAQGQAQFHPLWTF